MSHIKVYYDPTSKQAKIDEKPSPYPLKTNDSVTVNIGSGFTGNARITEVTFFEDATKKTSLGVWQRSIDKQPCPDLIKVKKNTHSVTFIDKDTPIADQPIWFGLTVHDDNGEHSVDPELILKKKD